MFVITGATGNVGRALVRELIERGESVRAVTRHPATAELPSTVDVVEGSAADADGLRSALRGATGLFVNPVGDVTPVLEALRAAPVQRVVLLSSITARTRPELRAAARMRSTEDRIRSVHAGAVALRPTQFMTNTLRWAPMIAAGRVRVPFVDVPVLTIAPEDIAAVAAEVLAGRPTARELTLTGPAAITPRERVAVLREVLGRDLDLEQWSEQEFRAANADVPEDELDYQVALTGSPNEAERHPTSLFEDLTGRPPRTFRQWAVANADRLLPPA